MSKFLVHAFNALSKGTELLTKGRPGEALQKSRDKECNARMGLSPQQLKPDPATHPLKLHQVNPEQGKLLHQGEFVIPSNRIALVKTGIPGQFCCGGASASAIARKKHIQGMLTIQWFQHVFGTSDVKGYLE